jgi:hypothetical protein
MTPVALPNTSEVSSLANQLLNKLAVPSAFELARLDYLIEKLSNVDIQTSQSFRGVYYALQGDGENALKWHKLALTHVPRHPDVYQCCAISLCYMEKYKEATNIALEGIRYTGENPLLIDLVLRGAYCSGDHDLIDYWLSRYEKLTGEKHYVATWLEEDAEDEAEMPMILEEAEREGYIPLEQVKKELGL